MKHAASGSKKRLRRGTRVGDPDPGHRGLAWLRSAGWISARVLPTPASVIEAGAKLALSGELVRNIWVSSWRALIGFLIGGGIGFVLAIVNGLSQFSEKLTDTSIQMVRTIPHLALIPLVILWFGIDEQARFFWSRSASRSRSTSTRSTASAPSIRS